MNKKEINILKKCAKNVLQFSRFVKILTNHGLDDFRPYSFQKKLLDKFSDGLKPESAGRRNHIVIAPRQCGKTTIIAIYALWYMIFNPDKSVAIISYKLDAAKEILYKIREIYCNLPEFIKPAATINNNKILTEYKPLTQISEVTKDNAFGHSLEDYILNEQIHVLVYTLLLFCYIVLYLDL